MVVVCFLISFTSSVLFTDLDMIRSLLAFENGKRGDAGCESWAATY